MSVPTCSCTAPVAAAQLVVAAAREQTQGQMSINESMVWLRGRGATLLGNAWLRKQDVAAQP